MPSKEKAEKDEIAMLKIMNLLAAASGVAADFKSPKHESIHNALLLGIIIVMAICAITAIILVLMQPGNSTGIDALGGSSETFFGKNKGKSIEAKMKKWTWICLILLVVFAIAFYVIHELPVFYS